VNSIPEKFHFGFHGKGISHKKSMSDFEGREIESILFRRIGEALKTSLIPQLRATSVVLIGNAERFGLRVQSLQSRPDGFAKLTRSLRTIFPILGKVHWDRRPRDIQIGWVWRPLKPYFHSGLNGVDDVSFDSTQVRNAIRMPDRLRTFSVSDGGQTMLDFRLCREG
jgi:hypothetical protein